MNSCRSYNSKNANPRQTTMALLFNYFPLARVFIDGKVMYYSNILCAPTFMVFYCTRFIYFVYLEYRERDRLTQEATMVCIKTDLDADVEKHGVRKVSALDDNGKLRNEVKVAVIGFRRDRCSLIVLTLLCIFCVFMAIAVPLALMLDGYYHKEDSRWLTDEFSDQKYENVSTSQLALWQE